MVCAAGLENYFDLGETVHQMVKHLMDEDEAEDSVPRGGAAIPKDDSIQIVGIPPNDHTILVSKSSFPGQAESTNMPVVGSADNPINLSDIPTDASTLGGRPGDLCIEDKAKVLSHYSDNLDEMAQCIADLEDGYFLALREVICETEKALHDISHIDSHYVSCVVSIMASWQEAVQAATSHMKTNDTAIYFTCHEDARRATKEYVVEVIKACEECNAAHDKEKEMWKQAIKADDPEDPVVCPLEAMCQAVHVQANRAMDAFIKKIKEMLRKHIPISAQGPLIANALSTCMQFQMSIWWMIGDECIRPVHAKHSDWCGLAGIIQAIVETLPNNCAIMFPTALVPDAAFSSTFQPAFSDDDDDDDPASHGTGLCQFHKDSPVPSGSGHGSHSSGLPITSTPLPNGGCFFVATDKMGVSNSSLGTPPPDNDNLKPQPYDEELELGMEADDENDGRKPELDGDRPGINPKELEILQGIVGKGQGQKPPSMPKLGDKQSSSHMEGSASSDSLGKDLDAKGVKNGKKGLMPTKVVPNPSQWTEEEIDVVHQYRYQTDVDRFQTYRSNHMDLGDLETINVKDHSAYIKVAKAHPGTVIE